MPVWEFSCRAMRHWTKQIYRHVQLLKHISFQWEPFESPVLISDSRGRSKVSQSLLHGWTAGGASSQRKSFLSSSICLSSLPGSIVFVSSSMPYRGREGGSWLMNLQLDQVVGPGGGSSLFTQPRLSLIAMGVLKSQQCGQPTFRKKQSRASSRAAV